MLTFFTTAKPFRGHSGVIQRNALKSWTLLHPDVEVILFGDDEGAAEVARELNIRHEAHTEKNEFGSKRLDYMFSRAQEISRHDLLCYSNCDIILMADFCHSLALTMAAHAEFLMVGRRWDTDISEAIDFLAPDWEAKARRRAVAGNQQRNAWYIDYFVFSRGLFGRNLPPLVVGRVFWDNWTIWKALDSKKVVVDASRAVVAIHQNHDYRYHPQGKAGVWSDEQAQRNLVLAGGWGHLRTIEDATKILRPTGIGSNRKRHWLSFRRHVGLTGRFLKHSVWNPIWFSVLDVTRPVRHALGLKARRKA